MHKFKRAALAVAAIAAVTAPVAVATSAPAQAASAHRIVFKTWGTTAYGTVDILGKHDITMRRHLPYTSVQYLSGIDLTFAMVSVEIPGYSNVGCSITDNGRLVARDVSAGMALCMR